jgi:hypothetical protein
LRARRQTHRADACHHAFFVEDLGQALCDCPYRAVANGVAELIVDRLQVVQVDQKEANCSVPLVGRADGEIKLRVEEPRVWQSGKRIALQGTHVHMHHDRVACLSPIDR